MRAHIFSFCFFFCFICYLRYFLSFNSDLLMVTLFSNISTFFVLANIFFFFFHFAVRCAPFFYHVWVRERFSCANESIHNFHLSFWYMEKWENKREKKKPKIFHFTTASNRKLIESIRNFSFKRHSNGSDIILWSRTA